MWPMVSALRMKEVPNEAMPSSRSIGVTSLLTMVLAAIRLSWAINTRSPGMIW